MRADCHRLEMSGARFLDASRRASPPPSTTRPPMPRCCRAGCLARPRRGRLKVTLCGEGGDELFGGYSRYRKRRAPWRWLTRDRRAASGMFRMAPPLAGWRDGIAAAEAERGRRPLAVAGGAGGGHRGVAAQRSADEARPLPDGARRRGPHAVPRSRGRRLRLPPAGCAEGRGCGSASFCCATGSRARFRRPAPTRARKASSRRSGAWMARARRRAGRTGRGPARRGRERCPRRKCAPPSPRPSARRSRPGRLLFTRFGTAAHVLGRPARGRHRRGAARRVARLAALPAVHRTHHPRRA